MITRRNNTTLFYATTFEAYPDNAKFEIWPVIVDVFQNWIVEKERRQRGNRTPSPARQIDFDISTALKWNQGMRLSAYSALTLRGAMASSLETWGSRKGTTSTKISSSVILGEIQKSLEPWVSNPSDDFMPLRSVRLSKSFAQGTMDIDAPSSSLTTRIMEGDRIPKHWAMDYSEQDSESWWRTWHTCVGITESSVGVYSVTVQVSYSIDPTYMRSDVKTPPRNVPICIRKLLDTEGIACTRFLKEPFSTAVHGITPTDRFVIPFRYISQVSIWTTLVMQSGIIAFHPNGSLGFRDLYARVSPAMSSLVPFAHFPSQTKSSRAVKIFRTQSTKQGVTSSQADTGKGKGKKSETPSEASCKLNTARH